MRRRFMMSGQSIPNPFANDLVVWFGGDSNNRGFGEVAGPTVPVGALEEWDGSAWVALTTAEVSTANVGSIVKQFALDFNARTGRKVRAICTGVNGSSFWPNAPGGITNNWMPTPTGVCYEPAVTKVANALASLGRSSVDIICFDLGINDEQGAVSTANFRSGVESLFDRLEALYPTAKKYWSILGRWPTSVFDQTIFEKRQIIKEETESRPRFAIFSAGVPFVFAAMMRADNVHFAQAANNRRGTSLDRMLATETSIPNKWARAGVASVIEPLTATKSAAIVALITYCYDQGFYMDLRRLCIYKINLIGNIYVDFAFVNSTSLSGATFSADNYVRGDGINDFIATGIVPLFCFDASDMFWGVHVVTNRDIATTVGGLFGGGASAAPFFGMAQNGASQLNVRANDSTVSSTGVRTRFGNGFIYRTDRVAGNKRIFEDSTQIGSDFAVAVVSGANDDIIELAWNTGGAISAWIDADVALSVAGRRSTIPDFAGFITLLKAASSAV